MVKGVNWPQYVGLQDMELKLDRMKIGLKLIGNPDQKLPPVIHVAGTNGKGSTIAFIYSILKEAGFKCHIYTSPHLVEFNERITVANSVVSDDILTTHLERVRESLGEFADTPTFFEALTLVAFDIFSSYEADFVLLEVGLGGKYDATNILNSTALSVITSISLDHQEHLGNTVAEIATQKAGIMKNGGKTVVGLQQYKEVYDVCQAHGAEIGNDVMFVKDADIQVEQSDLGMRGEFQIENAKTAIMAIEEMGLNPSKDVIKRGLQGASWKGRMQDITHLFPKSKSKVILDSAHNVAGAMSVASYIKPLNSQNNSQNVGIICAILKRKGCEDFLKLLPDVPTYFMQPSDDFYATLELENASPYSGVSSVQDIEEFLETAKFDTVVICGSIYFAGWIFEKYETAKR